MSNVDQQRANESIAGKQIEGGVPADLEFIRFNFALNVWEFVTAAAGEVNTGANVGAGQGNVFRDKIGVVLNFKTLLQGTNMTITDNADDITIATLAEINLATNVGAGAGLIFRDKTGVTLNLKSLLAGANITLTNNADDITIAASSAAAVTLSNQEDILTVTETTTSTTYVVTALSIVIANRAGGLAICTSVAGIGNSNQNVRSNTVLFDDASPLTGDIATWAPIAGGSTPCTLVSIVSLNGSTIDLRMKADANTANIEFAANSNESKLVVLEIS